MATSYYKQSSRDKVEGINWGQIGTDLSEKLTTEQTRRDDLKTEIDNESKEYVRGFNDMPQGTNQGANERLSVFADDASQYMLNLNKRLKAGDIKLKDYNAQKTNLEQGTTDMFQVSKDFNKNFDATMARVQSGEASALETWNNSNLQKFSDPSAAGLYIDPNTGQVVVADMIDGKPSQDPNGRSSIFSLKNKQSQQIDTFKIDKWATDNVAQFKNKYKTVFESNNVGSINSLLKSEDFVSAKKKIIESALTAPYSGQSILKDTDLEDKYTYSKNPEDEGKEGIIFLAPDPNSPNSGVLIPKLTKKQNAEASKILDEQINARLGYEETTSLDIDKTSTTLSNDAKEFANDFNELAKKHRLGKLRLDEEKTQQTVDAFFAKNEAELLQMGLNSERTQQIISVVALKSPKELEALGYDLEQKELNITNTEAIIDQREEKHESDMNKASTAQERAELELANLPTKQQNAALLNQAQIRNIDKLSQWEDKNAKEKRQVNKMVSKIGNIYDGTEAEIEASLAYLSSANANINSIDRTEKGLEVKMTDKEGYVINKIIPNTSNKRDFIDAASALLVNELNVTEAMDELQYDTTGSYATHENMTTVVQSDEDKDNSASFMLDELLETTVTNDMFDGVKAKDFKTTLASMTDSTNGSLKGFSNMRIEDVSGTTTNEIVISFPNVKETLTINPNAWTTSGARKEKRKLQEYLNSIGQGNLEGLASNYDWGNVEVTGGITTGQY
jgi:hypothetical protein